MDFYIDCYAFADRSPANTLGFEDGIDRTYVNSVEQGKRNISLVTNNRLAQDLDVETAELLRKS